MTNDEAKFRLQAYRSNGADGADPAMLEALEHAQRDEALRAWLAREQAFDAVVAAKLREVSPPAGLRESILAGTQMTRRSGALTRRRFPAWLAQAAAVALLVAVATIAVRLFEAKAPATVDDLVHLAVDDLKP
ncbi:MAG TPA: hypothetical protein VHF69_00680, partial [Candidatus Synoicihabitans sp.]|nr:hypothetical protein [Candidatus Synoicihabitans sp.]